MRTTVGSRTAPAQRFRLVIAAALVTLSLGLGAAMSAQPVGATTVCYKDPGRGIVCTKIP